MRIYTHLNIDISIKYVYTRVYMHNAYLNIDIYNRQQNKYYPPPRGVN